MAGHAFLDSFCKSPPEVQQAYRESGGTKIVLAAKNDSILRALFAAAEDRGIPCATIVDEGHTHFPDFDGSPTLAALGIGPASREQLRPLLKRLSLMK